VTTFFKGEVTRDNYFKGVFKNNYFKGDVTRDNYFKGDVVEKRLRTFCSTEAFKRPPKIFKRPPKIFKRLGHDVEFG